MMVKSKRGRIVTLDIARVVAILMVVMIHASAIFATQHDKMLSGFLVGSLLDSISRVGVPLFIMISGALLLNEDKLVSGRYVAKKIKNITFLLAAWSLFYAIVFGIGFYNLRGGA